ncbi:MAG: endonuclease domain-containing protein [Oscillospiraceae bacterium]|nr:endonuclease domain-containing protein [Oscillospiraceae bacterium]MBQ4316017.1 endonuclease domain-containing protein [Oscillospiraceae bacterium]MBQ6697662.1 endonuclease domain-containing protein [Oscillospiraceae bacterium]MBQ7054943.1 endonuclease domain-containing protein [Oscillospiraceae bacterium]
MSLTYKKNLIPLAKVLRKNMTKQEQHLWYDFLRKSPLRFQRQKVIDGYIADFYCHSAKLVIEIDGSQHYTDKALEYDEERTSVINSYGIEVLRFTNRDIDTRFKDVCMTIHEKIQQKHGK